MLGGEPTLHRPVRTEAELLETVRSGLPRTALDRVVRCAAGEGLAAMELEHTVVPPSTLRRRRGWLCEEESARLERLARMTVLAGKVLGDPARVRSFLTAPHPALGGEPPCALARSEAETLRVAVLLGSLGAPPSSRTAPRPRSPRARPASAVATGAPRSRASPLS